MTTESTSAEEESMTMTVTVNVIDGSMRVEHEGEDDDLLTLPDGTVDGSTWDLTPWGAEEDGMERAEAALADAGWVMAGPWSGQETQVRASVRRAVTVALKGNA